MSCGGFFFSLNFVLQWIEKQVDIVQDPSFAQMKAFLWSYCEYPEKPHLVATDHLPCQWWEWNPGGSGVRPLRQLKSRLGCLWLFLCVNNRSNHVLTKLQMGKLPVTRCQYITTNIITVCIFATLVLCSDWWVLKCEDSKAQKSSKPHTQGCSAVWGGGVH